MTAHNSNLDKFFLVVSNKPDTPWAYTLKEALTPLGQLHFVREEEALAQIGQRAYDLIIIASGDIEGEIGDCVKSLRQTRLDIPLVVTTNSPTWRRAREVFRAGATDYVRRTLDKEKILSFYQGILQEPSPNLESRDISVNGYGWENNFVS